MSQEQTSTPEHSESSQSADALKDAQRIQADKQLIADMFNGDKKAGAAFYEQYYRLIKMLANQARSGSDDAGTVVERDDYDQAMFEQVLMAARAYNAKAEPLVPFISYIKGDFLLPTVKSAMFNDRHSVKLPVDVVQKVRTMNAINNNRKFAQRPFMTDEEIAQELGVNIGRAAEIRRAAVIAQHIGSLDSGFSPRRDDDRGNQYILDERTAFDSLTTDLKSFEDLTEPEEMKRLVRTYLDRVEGLSERDRLIVELYFGFRDDKPIQRDPKQAKQAGAGYSTDEIGNIVELSHTRVAKIIQDVLAKLRKLSAKELDESKRRYAADPRNYASEIRSRRSGYFRELERGPRLKPYDDRGLAEYR